MAASASAATCTRKGPPHFSSPSPNPDWQGYTRRLGSEISWKKTALIWQDNIISGGKSFSNKGPLIKAVDAVRAAIGMAPADPSQEGQASGGIIPKIRELEPVA